MSLNFSANIDTLFTELPFLDRIAAAKAAGFKAIEILWPYDHKPEDIAAAKGDLKIDLMNLWTEPGTSGCAAHPLKGEDFVRTTEHIKAYYNLLLFRKLHILSGDRLSENFSFEEQVNTLQAALQNLVDSDFLETFDMIGLIEPICVEVKNKYFLSSFDTAAEIVRAINSPYIKLQLDVYHLHKITGDVKKNLEKYYDCAGHIQISQDPGRYEPFHPDGKIDYHQVFDFLRQKEHTDYIGLEYTPSESTEKSLDWFKNFK